MNSYGSTIEEHLRHFCNAHLSTGLDDDGMSPCDALSDVEIFQSQNRHHILKPSPGLSLTGNKGDGDRADKKRGMRLSLPPEFA